MFLQAQNIVCFIKCIEGSKPYANQVWNVFDTNVGYPLNVEAIYLPSEGRYLLKQRNAAARVVTIGTFIDLMHSLRVIQPYSIYHTVLGNCLRSVYPCIGYLSGVIWKKPSINSEKYRRIPASFAWLGLFGKNTAHRGELLSFFRKI